VVAAGAWSRVLRQRGGRLRAHGGQGQGERALCQRAGAHAAAHVVGHERPQAGAGVGGDRSDAGYDAARELRATRWWDRADHREHDSDHRGGEEVGMNAPRSWLLALSTFGLATTIACDSPTSTPVPDPPAPVNVTDVS